uniref:Uncharacterized protein n=1 Tax=Chenopodium quinoa TaxID=63459 RepID=A0A803KM12_CHEQI
MTDTTNDFSWLSPSGDFAFGFSKLPNSSNLFLLAIWYAKIPSTIVWHANDGIPVPQGSSVKITTDKGLVLSEPSGIDLWSTSADLTDGGEVSYGFLYDTGNIVLKGSNDNETVWQSFDHPTDTLLPSQQLKVEVKVNSWLSQTNFTKGRFQLHLIPDGNLVLNTRDLTTGFAYGAYYTSGTNENPEIAGQRLVYNESGYMFILRRNGSRQDLLPPYKVESTKDNYHRATLSFDGVLTWYSVPKASISEGCAIGLGIFIYHKRKLRAFDEGQRQPLKEYSNVHRFSYQELYEATNGFKEELGRGAFGVVYKGMVSGGGPPICVAVKKLDRMSGDTNKEFKTEVNVTGQPHHKNLVQVVGFCKEDDQRLLVYEYMSNDEHQNVRISDFGLAKLLALNQTHTNTGIRGTKGYVAPEWFRHKPVTVKVDVYSYGVLLLEIICCRKSICMELIEEEGAILTDWAFDCYQSNRLDVLVNDDREALNDMLRLKRLVLVALWCIQEDPSLRPTMRTITQMLDGLVEVPINPPPSSISITTQNYIS